MMHEWMPVLFGWGPSFFLDRGHFLVGRRGVGACDRQMGGVAGRRGSQMGGVAGRLMAAIGRVVMYSAAAAGRQGRTSGPAVLRPGSCSRLLSTMAGGGGY